MDKAACLGGNLSQLVENGQKSINDATDQIHNCMMHGIKTLKRRKKECESKLTAFGVIYSNL